MRLRRRAVSALFVATAAVTALAPRAVAAPMPWETSRTPTAPAHGTTSVAADGSGTVTVLCGNPCYQ
ncbi:hypothetical protein [Streptomyces sp. NPDC046870]|uniref:hypothetical protein n=1 Tax=Streptomyces sp. NPDC046870 TaxID=3155135 RepID=UPI0034535799